MSLRPPQAVWQNMRDISRWCFEQRPQDFPITTVVDTGYTVGNESLILVDDDTAGGAVTINLPPAAFNKGLTKHVKKLGTTGTVTIDANGSETIDGATTLALTTQYDGAWIISDGTEWWIV